MANKRAVVVGINEYPPPNHLPSCVNDANTFKSLLTSEFGFAEKDITVLTNTDATIANLEAAINSMLKGAAKDDRFVFYFS